MTLLERYKTMLPNETSADRIVELSYRIFILEAEKALEEEINSLGTLESCSAHLKKCEFLKAALLFPTQTGDTKNPANEEFKNAVYKDFTKYNCIVKATNYKANMKRTLVALLRTWHQYRQNIMHI